MIEVCGLLKYTKIKGWNKTLPKISNHTRVRELKLWTEAGEL